MTDPRSQAFEKQQGVRDSLTRGGASADAAGLDARASLMQSWELSGEAMGLPIDPFAPAAGDAAFAQSHAWAQAMGATDGPAASPWSVAGHVDPALAGDDSPGGWARAPAADSTAKAPAVPAPGRGAAVVMGAAKAPAVPMARLAEARVADATAAKAPAVPATAPGEAMAADASTVKAPADPATAPAEGVAADLTTAKAPAEATATPAEATAEPAPEATATPAAEATAAPATETTAAAGTKAAAEPAAEPATEAAAESATEPATAATAEPTADASAMAPAEPAAEATAAAPAGGETTTSPDTASDGGHAAATPGGEAGGTATPDTASETGPAATPGGGGMASADTASDGGHASAAASGGGGGGGSSGGGDMASAGGDAEVQSDDGGPDAPGDDPADDAADDAAEEAREDEEEDADLDAEMSAIGAGVAEPALGGGGGGGAAITDQPAPPAPDVSQAAPEAGLAKLAGLRPDRLATALGGLGAAVATDVGEQRAALAAAPPTRDTRGDGEAPEAAPPAPGTAQAAPAPERAPDVPLPAPAPTPAPAGPLPADTVAAPAVQGGEGGALSDADTRAMASSVARLPTRDPAATASVGPAPKVPMQGSADPAEAKRARAALEGQLGAAVGDARRDAAQPMGEDAITVTTPAATLTAQVPAGQAAQPGAAPTLPGPEQAEAIGIIAGQQEGARIDAALTKARADMGSERQKHTEAEAQQRADADAAITQLETDAAAEQDREKTAARAEVGQLRGQWQDEVDQQTGQARQEADAQVAEGTRKVEAEQQKGEAEAEKATAEGEHEAGKARADGEAEAEKQKKDGEKEAGGFFGWLASKAKAFFDRVKKGISAALAKARALVKAAIDKAKKLAAAAIEAARKVIVAAIEIVGKALIAIGDRLLAGFPALRDKFRASIEKRVQQATDAVNAAAKKLNDGVQAALDGLGKGLDAALGLLEKGLHFIVDGVNGLVQGAIKAAEGLVSGIAGFAALIKDIAAGPGQWIGNLGVAVKDGIQNHLWGAFKTAVRAWLESKLMEVLGIGGVVIKTLIEGGFDMPRIAETAWEGLKAAIPIALISLLIEKLVSMIVPAAGAVMAIIEGLQAAWGTVSRIVAAFAAFMAFLRLVKSGNAGPAFAQALAAGAVVVIDFVSNWLIKKIVKAAKAVGRKLKGIAQKLMKKLKRKGGKGKKGSGKKKPDGKKDKDKDKNKDDAAARREAKKAARSGWSAAKAKASRQVMSKEAVEQSLRGAEGTQAGVKIKLDVQAQGKGWTVKATGSKKGRTATATHGRGSTLRTKQGGTFYAAADIRPVEKRVEAMTRSALAQDEASDGAADASGALSRRLDKARSKGQSMLDGRVKGLRLTLAVDKAKAGAGQKAVVVALVEPNYHEWKIDLAGEGLEAIRAALQKVARRKGRYNQQLARLQQIANKHGAQVDFAGAPEPNASQYDFVKVIKVTFTKNGEKLVAGLTRDATGAHEGTLSNPGRCAATGRPLAHDPTTGAPVSATRPHDAVSAAMWKKEIEALGLQAGKAPSDPIISALTAAAGNAGNWFMVGDGRVANQHKHSVLPANPNKPGKPQSLESLHGDKSAEKRRHVADNAAVDQATGEILIEYGNASPQHGSNLASVKPQHLKGDDWAKLSPKETRAAVQARIRIAINGLEAVAKAHPDHAAATWLTEAFFTRLENRVYNAAIKKS